MTRAGGLPGGLITEVKNQHSQKYYFVSTAPEIGQDYWTTAILSSTVQTRWFGLVRRRAPNPLNQLAGVIRNTMKEAHKAHGEVSIIVGAKRESDWLMHLPSPTPRDGFSVGARRKLNKALGFDVEAAPAKMHGAGLDASEAQAIVKAFVRHVAEGMPYIGDTTTLPHPKPLIEAAFRIHLAEFESIRKADAGLFSEAGLAEDYQNLCSLFIRLDDWKLISPEDREAVAVLNKLEGPPPNWAMPLFEKYGV